MSSVIHFKLYPELFEICKNTLERLRIRGTASPILPELLWVLWHFCNPTRASVSSETHFESYPKCTNPTKHNLGTFHGEMDRCRERQGWTTASSRMPERDGKSQGENRPKQAGSCWFARPCWLTTGGANLYPPGIWFADVMTHFSGVTFVLFCFVFVFTLSLKLRPIVQSFFDMQAPR